MKMRNQAGFSLLEMIVAVAITLVITGAVYGLIAGGNNAFRREPELTERQQNARMAMDLLIRDVATTGSAMPAFIQAFTRSLDACNATPAGRCPLGGAAGYAPGVTGALPDDIQMIGNPGNFEGEATCHYGKGVGGGASNVFMRSGGTNVNQNEIIIVIMSDGTYSLVNAIDTSKANKSSADNCDQQQWHTAISFNSGAGDATKLNVSGGLCGKGITGTSEGGSCNPVMIARGEIVRYGIRLDADGIPNLYRFSTGTLNGQPVNTANWQLVAKGIEDMQVQYRHLDPNALPMAPAPWVDQPPVATCNPANPNGDCCDPGCVLPTCSQALSCSQPTAPGMATLVTEVRVTLTSRSEARNIQGATRSVAGGDRIRGSLTQTISPRATLFALSRIPGGTAWR